MDRKQESKEEGVGHGVDIVLRTNVVNVCLWMRESESMDIKTSSAVCWEASFAFCTSLSTYLFLWHPVKCLDSEIIRASPLSWTWNRQHCSEFCQWDNLGTETLGIFLRLIELGISEWSQRQKLDLPNSELILHLTQYKTSSIWDEKSRFKEHCRISILGAWWPSNCFICISLNKRSWRFLLPLLSPFSFYKPPFAL